MARVLLILAALSFIGMPALAIHDEGCTPSSADPSTYTVIVSPLGGRTFYLEERGGVHEPVIVPLSGALLGGATWWYEESNALDGLQRGGFFGVGGCFPNEDLCMFPDEESVYDETCGHGPDAWILGMQRGI